MSTSPSVRRAGESSGDDWLRVLGRTGIRVSPLCLGGMNLGSWANADRADCRRIIDASLDAGINVIDTADVYSAGESEQLIGEALGTRRDRIVLATKFSAPMGGDPNAQGGSRRWIMQAVDGSLARLGTDWIDLYQLHRADAATDLEETIDALSDLVTAGKIRSFGASTMAAHEIVRGQWIAERRGLRRFSTEQPPYSLLVRRAEAEVLPVCREHGLGVLCWSPLAGGWLSGHFRAGGGAAADVARSNRAARMPDRFDLSSPQNRAKLEAVEALGALAAEAGTTLPVMAIAFVINHPAVTSAIIGPRTPDQVTAVVEAARLRLTDELLDRIDEVVAPGTTLNPSDDDHLRPIGLRDKRTRRRAS